MEQITSIPLDDPNIGAMVVEAGDHRAGARAPGAAQLGLQHAGAQRGIDDTVVQLLRGDFCNHALHIDRLSGRRPEDHGERTGVGLYVLLAKATRVIVNVAPGSCTEVISYFDLDWPVSYQGVRSFHYFEEKKWPAILGHLPDSVVVS